MHCKFIFLEKLHHSIHKSFFHGVQDFFSAIMSSLRTDVESFLERTNLAANEGIRRHPGGRRWGPFRLITRLFFQGERNIGITLLRVASLGFRMA